MSLTTTPTTASHSIARERDALHPPPSVVRREATDRAIRAASLPPREEPLPHRRAHVTLFPTAPAPPPDPRIETLEAATRQLTADNARSSAEIRSLQRQASWLKWCLAGATFVGVALLVHQAMLMQQLDSSEESRRVMQADLVALQERTSSLQSLSSQLFHLLEGVSGSLSQLGQALIEQSQK